MPNHCLIAPASVVPAGTVISDATSPAPNRMGVAPTQANSEHGRASASSARPKPVAAPVVRLTPTGCDESYAW